MRLLWGKKTEEILKDRIDYVEYIERNNLTDQWQDDAVLELLKQSERYKHLSIPEMVRGLIYECNIPALTALGQKIFPFFDLGLGWVVPALIGLVIGLVLTVANRNKAGKAAA